MGGLFWVPFLPETTSQNLPQSQFTLKWKSLTVYHQVIDRDLPDPICEEYIFENQDLFCVFGKHRA